MKNWMILFAVLLSSAVLFLMSGCAAPKSSITKKYDIGMDTETGHNVLVLVLDADVQSDTDVKQDAKMDARTKLDTALSQSGSTLQNARDSAGATMDGIKSILDATSETIQPDSNKKSSNEELQSVADPVVVPVEMPEQKVTEPDGELKTETHDALKIAAGKKHRWLNETGAYYGKDVVFKWPGCESFTVPDAAKNHGRDGNTSNYNQAFFFAGTDQKDHRTYKGHPDYEDAAVFADPGCAADSVTVLYRLVE